jgi:glycosyltransferase involved in cell wall biosynthesis
MKSKVYVFDPTANDQLSRVRGIGRYLQILRENFEKEFIFTNHLPPTTYHLTPSVFINPFFNFLKPPLLMKRIAQKQIAVIHDLIPLKYPTHFPIGIKGKLNVFLNKLSLNNYDLIITDSEASKRDIIYILGLKSEKIKAVYPCLPKIFINLESRIQSLELKEKQIQNSKFNSEFSIINSKFCLYVGDATWNKNLVNLARAIKEINVTCVFVGKVFEKILNIKNQISKLHLKNQKDNNLAIEQFSNLLKKTFSFSHPWNKEYVQFIQETYNDNRFIFSGFVPDEQLINLYKQAKCNILPSRDEGFGFSYIESAFFACPSLLSDISVLQEISGGNALFADPNNVSDLANKIGELYYGEITRKQIGQKAYKRSQFFSPANFKKSFIDILEKM